MPHSPAARVEIEDRELVERAAGGDHDALHALVERFGDRLCSYLYRIVGDGGWADDLTQEVFVRVLSRGTTYDPRWPVSVWLFGTARNLAVDLLRRERRRRGGDVEAVPLPHSPSAADTAEHMEFQAHLEAAIQRLPEGFRSVLLLRDAENLSYEEIGASLGLSPKTVSSRLHRARSQIREQLKPHLQR